MKWTSHPFLENKRRTVLLIVFLAALFTGLYIWFGLWGLVIGLILVGTSVYSYFIPTRYEMNDEKILIKGLFMTKKKQWIEFRSFYPDRNGVLLSPFVVPSRLENFRGVYIRFGNKHYEVIEYIEKKINKKKQQEE